MNCFRRKKVSDLLNSLSLNYFEAYDNWKQQKCLAERKTQSMQREITRISLKCSFKKRFIPYSQSSFPPSGEKEGEEYATPSKKYLYLRWFLHQSLEKPVQIPLVSDFFFLGALFLPNFYDVKAFRQSF